MFDEAALPQDLHESIIDNLNFIWLEKVDWMLEHLPTFEVLRPESVRDIHQSESLIELETIAGGFTGALIRCPDVVLL